MFRILSHNYAFQNEISACMCVQRQNTVSGTAEEFHSLPENEAPDMNVHSLAARVREMKDDC